MTTHTASNRVHKLGNKALSWQEWVKLGLIAAFAAIILVIVIQALAISTWPEIAAFKPLDNYARTALFTLVPALIATALFARLARSSKDPVASFIKIAIVVLLLSFIPDYLLPDPNKTFLASSVAAFLHLIAGIVITAGLVIGYKRSIEKS